MSDLVSYKPYARFISIVSAIIAVLSILDANQLINLFPAYSEQITIFFTLIGVIAPMIGQEKRVKRAEELQLDKSINGIQLSVDGVVIPDDVMNINHNECGDAIKVDVVTNDINKVSEDNEEEIA